MPYTWYLTNSSDIFVDMNDMDDDDQVYDGDMDTEGNLPESEDDEESDLSCDMCEFVATHRQMLSSHKKRVHGTTCVKCAQGLKN